MFLSPVLLLRSFLNMLRIAPLKYYGNILRCCHITLALQEDKNNEELQPLRASIVSCSLTLFYVLIFLLECHIAPWLQGKGNLIHMSNQQPDLPKMTMPCSAVLTGAEMVALSPLHPSVDFPLSGESLLPTTVHSHSTEVLINMSENKSAVERTGELNTLPQFAHI